MSFKFSDFGIDPNSVICPECQAAAFSVDQENGQVSPGPELATISSEPRLVIRQLSTPIL